MRMRMYVLLTLGLELGMPAYLAAQQPGDAASCAEAVGMAAKASTVAALSGTVRDRLPGCPGRGHDEIARLVVTVDASTTSLDQVNAWNYFVKNARIFSALQALALDAGRPTPVRHLAISALVTYINSSWDVMWPSAESPDPASIGERASGSGVRNEAVPDAADQVFAMLGTLEESNRGTSLGNDAHNLRQTLLLKAPNVGTAMAMTAFRLTPKCDRGYRLENRSDFALFVQLEGATPAANPEMFIKARADGLFYVPGDAPVRVLYKGREVTRSTPALNSCR